MVYHYDGQNWDVTDPFGWQPYLIDSDAEHDPLQCYNGEQSRNIWIGGEPRNVGHQPKPYEEYATNTQAVGGWPDQKPPVATWITPNNDQSITERTVRLQANASDDSTGVKMVRFSVNYGSGWKILFHDDLAPYEYTWDLCAEGVPYDANIELGLQAWDNADNQFVYSDHNPNYKIRMKYRCDSSPTDRARLYALANYRNELGNYGTGFTNDPNANSYSMELPDGWSAKTWRGDNRSGEERCWPGSVSSLQDHGWQNAIQSIEVFNSNVCPQPPAAPTVYALGFSAYSITPYWTNVANENGYRVYRLMGGNYTLIGTTGADQTSYDDTGLNCGTTPLSGGSIQRCR